MLTSIISSMYLYTHTMSWSKRQEVNRYIHTVKYPDTEYKRNVFQVFVITAEIVSFFLLTFDPVFLWWTVEGSKTISFFYILKCIHFYISVYINQ